MTLSFQTLQPIPGQNVPALMGVHEGADVPPQNQDTDADTMAHGDQPLTHKTSGTCRSGCSSRAKPACNGTW